MISVRGVVVLFTASTAARLVFHSAADCSVICVFTDDKFSWLGCCACDFRLSHWMSWAMRSCSALGESRGAGSACCQFRRRQSGRGADYRVFVERDVGQVIVLLPGRGGQINRKYTSCRLTVTLTPPSHTDFTCTDISLFFHLFSNSDIWQVGTVSGYQPEDGTTSEYINLIGCEMINESGYKNKHEWWLGNLPEGNSDII